MPNDVRTNVVYTIDCQDCCQDCFLYRPNEKTSMYRLKEHFKNIKLHMTCHSVIRKNKLEFGHNFDWTTPSILHNEKHVRKRENAEMFFY